MKNVFLLRDSCTNNIIGIWNSLERAKRTAVKILKRNVRDDGVDMNSVEIEVSNLGVVSKYDGRFYDEICIERFHLNQEYDSTEDDQKEDDDDYQDIDD